MNDPLDAPADRAPEEIIANAIVEVATELRLADAADLVLLVANEQSANIADLVNSSTELFFKSGTLRYALSAGCSVKWDSTPIVRLDMEFRHASVCAFFRLSIGGRRAAVEIVDMLFDERGLDQHEKNARLSAALAGARRTTDAAADRKPRARRADHSH